MTATPTLADLTDAEALTLATAVMAEPACTEPACDGELHYGGRDPLTNEDLELGPCPAVT